MSIPFMLLLKSVAGGAFALLALLMVAGPLLLGHTPTGVEQTAAAISGAVIGAWLALRA
jgi:hypothetical protein